MYLQTSNLPLQTMLPTQLMPLTPKPKLTLNCSPIPFNNLITAITFSLIILDQNTFNIKQPAWFKHRSHCPRYPTSLPETHLRLCMNT